MAQKYSKLLYDYVFHVFYAFHCSVDVCQHFWVSAVLSVLLWSRILLDLFLFGQKRIRDYSTTLFGDGQVSHSDAAGQGIHSVSSGEDSVFYLVRIIAGNIYSD